MMSGITYIRTAALLKKFQEVQTRTYNKQKIIFEATKSNIAIARRKTLQ